MSGRSRMSRRGKISETAQCVTVSESGRSARFADRLFQLRTGDAQVDTRIEVVETRAREVRFRVDQERARRRTECELLLADAIRLLSGAELDLRRLDRGFRFFHFG